MSAAEVRAFLEERHAQVAPLALEVRDLLLAVEPDFDERVYRGWDGIGFRHPDGGYVCAIYPQEDHVRLLFEHGASLYDPDGSLEGGGGQTRYLVVRRLDRPTAAQAERFVSEAVSERVFRRA